MKEIGWFLGVLVCVAVVVMSVMMQWWFNIAIWSVATVLMYLNWREACSRAR